MSAETLALLKAGVVRPFVGHLTLCRLPFHLDPWESILQTPIIRHDCRLHSPPGLQRFKHLNTPARHVPLLHVSSLGLLLVHIVFDCVARAIVLQSSSPANSYRFVSTRSTRLAQRRNFCNFLFQTNAVLCRRLSFRPVRRSCSSFPSHFGASHLHLL